MQAGSAEEAWRLACVLLRDNPNVVTERTRTGEVRRFNGPAVVHIENPLRRVIFDPERACNPFFHLIEALWMLGGKADVLTLSHFNKRMAEYSDDGLEFNAAYGYRWRHAFLINQVDAVIDSLLKDEKSRRNVIQMWAPPDLGSSSKDVPCNTHIYFSTCPNDSMTLNMAVSNRSNDLCWGMFGANIVHMTMLQEYVALAASMRVGSYSVFSNNLHYYPRHYKLVEDVGEKYDKPHSKLGAASIHNTPYNRVLVAHHPLFTLRDRFDEELQMLLHELATPEPGMCSFGPFEEPFLANVVVPMLNIWFGRMREDMKSEREASFVTKYKHSNSDWLRAAAEWIDARRN